MAETTLSNETEVAPIPSAGGRTKFIVGGVFILAAMVYLIVMSTAQNAQYFITVDELLERQDTLTGQNIRMSGVVLGDSINYDAETLTLTFDVAHIPISTAEIDDEGGLAVALHQAATNPDAQKVQVVVVGQPKPDLLQNEAQAIVEGELGTDGVFHADTLLLKCPTRYEEALPEQAS